MIAPHSGQSSQLLVDADDGSAQFLATLAGSALNLPLTPDPSEGCSSSTATCQADRDSRLQGISKLRAWQKGTTNLLLAHSRLGEITLDQSLTMIWNCRRRQFQYSATLCLRRSCAIDKAALLGGFCGP
jgi:hypothetical protein